MTQWNGTENIYQPQSTIKRTAKNHLQPFEKIKNIKYLHEKDQQRDAKVKMNLNKRFFLYYFDDSIDLEEDPNIAAQEMVISFPFMYIYIKSVGSY